MDIKHGEEKASPRKSHDRHLYPNILPKHRTLSSWESSINPNIHPHTTTNHPLHARIIPPPPQPTLPREQNDPSTMASIHPPEKQMSRQIPTQSLDARPPRSQSSLQSDATPPTEAESPRPNLRHHLRDIILPQPELPLRDLHNRASKSRLVA